MKLKGVELYKQALDTGFILVIKNIFIFIHPEVWLSEIHYKWLILIFACENDDTKVNISIDITIYKQLSH
ncbi:MAG TPA: hypothetical protein DD761_06075 [Cyanobacteria bacterium UBA11691]|nr:hypothetical protein [Cyanobacteria bacterium UBA11691]